MKPSEVSLRTMCTAVLIESAWTNPNYRPSENALLHRGFAALSSEHNLGGYRLVPILILVRKILRSIEESKDPKSRCSKRIDFVRKVSFLLVYTSVYFLEL